MAALEWFFTQTIYGLFVLAALVYGVATLLKKVVPRSPSPTIVAALAFGVLLASVPSYPRFKFERDTLAVLKSSPQTKVVATTQWGDLAEPLTWFGAPIGSFHTVTPAHPLQGGGFHRVILRYGEPPLITLEDPDCEDNTKLVSAPGRDGFMHYTTKEPLPMSSEDIELFCKADWTREREAVLRAATSNP